MGEKLDEKTVEKAVKNIEGWILLPDDKIEKIFLFSDFKKAFSFMSVCAQYAEKVNHHPEWKNTYNKVTVVLTTHDVGGLSELDFDMASFMDKEFKT